MPLSPTLNHTLSHDAYLRARQVMPGGVSSPVRAYKAVGGSPIFIREGVGCLVKDIDGNSYIDYVGSYGPLIAGHAEPRIVTAVAKAAGRGMSFGMPTELETQLAEKIIAALPSVEMVRFVNSGTEAVMSALRLARAATGRDKIVKCTGCYHGHSDALLVQAGSGALTFGTPSSPGVPASITAQTLVAEYNDLDAAAALFRLFPDQIACFIVEPVAGNMGVVPPAEGYLAGLRKLCDENGTLLIFDEVMTGFRVAFSGAQSLYNIRPDLTCLGKIIGGGLPVGAYAGQKKWMERISPAGPVYQAGTLSGNPMATSAGLATFDILQEPKTYDTLEARSALLADGLQKASKSTGVPLTINRVGSMLTAFFVSSPGKKVANYTDATACDTARFATFFTAMLARGICLPPSQFEALFVSLAHSEEVIRQTIAMAEESLAAVKGS